MLRSGLAPDQFALGSVVRTCAGLLNFLLGRQLHGHAVKSGLVDEAIVLFLEMRWLGLKPDDITVRRQLPLLPSKGGLMQMFPSATLYFPCIRACVQHRQLEEAFQLFKCMRSSMKDLDHITLNTILSACADLASFDIGKHIHAYSFKVGLETDIMVRNGLIDAYAKCGSLDDARKLFEMMGNNRDVFSWSSLIVGYAQFGYVKESLELFALMRSLGINPNHVTLVGVLTACSRVGFVNEGLYYYNIMEHEYGIVPTKEHSSCVIDLLARAGRLDEAAKFIDQMPFEPDIVMWKTLLAACRVRNNVEIGKRAAEAILKIDPSDSAAYVLLCSIYASSGHWDEFAMLKKLMKSSGVRKFPGKSWIKKKGSWR
ncbi:Pentatricopeptide repeat-containing protein, mitochondrial [Ananas comosus]|uniref:Pentatricopeptide repeat-containing protein, mitochondrial n=1 Tax=Ananas comosus TaxID=4615 RepID=A0A199V1D8_ANACO|nr:Pentatricopeptide repeat-containing protein, mitochondrial [Ananas comosus]